MVLTPFLLQLPFDSPSFSLWFEVLGLVLNLAYALAVRGYILLVLVGFMVYVTGVSDGTAKGMVVLGVALFLVGPQLLSYAAAVTGTGTITIDTAGSAWFSVFGMYESEMVQLVLSLGDLVTAVGLLAGAILYFTPSSGDLKARGQSLMVRALMLAPILAFLYFTPWI
jgi:hypothetical protein